MLNYLAIVLAAIASFAFGAAWYGALAKPWLAARGAAAAPAMARLGPLPVPYLIAFVAELVMAWMLAGILLHLEQGGLAAGVRNGLISAGGLWRGLAGTASVVV